MRDNTQKEQVKKNVNVVIYTKTNIYYYYYFLSELYISNYLHVRNSALRSTNVT